jgi:hypothetical protein
MRRFSLLDVVVLALVASGCLGDSSTKTVHPGLQKPATSVRVAMQVEQMRIPAGNLPPLTDVRCSVKGSLVTCAGLAADGSFKATQALTIESDGSLKPWCPQGKSMPPIFCAQ